MDGTELTLTEQLTPYLPLIGTIFGGIVVGAFAAWNRKRGNVETKAPSVAEIWAREERLTRRNGWLSNAVYRLQSAFRRYVARVQSGGPTDLTSVEQELLDLDISDDD